MLSLLEKSMINSDIVVILHSSAFFQQCLQYFLSDSDVGILAVQKSAEIMTEHFA